MSNPSTPFRLLDLPVELREQILRYALKVPYHISPRVSIPRDAFVLRLPALTATCRLIRKEALPLYFEENTFHFNLKDVLEEQLDQDLRFDKKLLTFGAWCEAAGLERISKVKRVSIDLAKGRMHIPEVLMTMRRFGKVEVELQWLRPDGKEPQHEVRPAPESLVRVVKYAVEKNPRAASILPKGIVQFCTEMVLTGTGVSVVWEDIMRVG